MNLKFRNRVALFNTLAVALTTALVFIVIYFVVHDTSYDHLDENILAKKEKVFDDLGWNGNAINISKMSEWDKAEHSRIEVTPVFLQITNQKGKVIFRSAALLKGKVFEGPKNRNKTFYNGSIGNQKIRLGRFPIKNDAGKTVGELTIAISEEGSFNVLSRLIRTLIISFPAVLVILYLVSSLAASKAINPVNQLIRIASRINDSNISTRLALPVNKDELYELTKTFNELLTRIETSLIQQKQFTSDASHEIRTPIAAIRGTLEVLVRKERESRIYIEKISGIIKEFDRLDTMLDQLLQLTRVESEKASANKEKIKLNESILLSMKKWKSLASKKKISQITKVPENVCVVADRVYLELILDNLLNNALKYGKEHGSVFFNWDDDLKTLAVKDNGIGIAPEHLPNIFNRFYRSDESRSSSTKGNGLGLSIAKKLADIQGIRLTAESVQNLGSTFYLHFPI